MAINTLIKPVAKSIELEPSDDFVATQYIQDLTERAVAYLDIGYPVHFAGPSGTGKTTLAFHVAAQLGRPVILIHGDDEFGSSDLIGRDSGYRKSKVVDNYIHSVLKTDERMNVIWADKRVSTACKQGYTLIYDEFTRSKPEANNAFLSILEEKILDLSSIAQKDDGYFNVHPNFRVIFTSNPEEYAGVHKTQDALMDRLISINLGHPDRETEIKITIAKSNISHTDAEIIVDLVRELRGVGANNHLPTIRASIALARILVYRKGHANGNDQVFRQACYDVLNRNAAKITCQGQTLMSEKIKDLLLKICKKNGEKSLKKITP